MKQRGLLKACTFLFATALMVMSFGSISAEAGASTIVVDNSSFQDELDTATWSNPDSMATVENGVLVFPENSTADTRLITKIAARASEKEEVLLRTDATICLEKLPKGGKFIIAFGLSSIEGITGETGNVEVEFSNNGGVKAMVVAYGDEGAKKIIPSTFVGRMNSDMKVSVVITKNKEITVTVGGKSIGKGKLPVDGEGRLGFLQTGSCAAKVKAVKFVSYQYDKPENSNIVEDFEKGGINQTLLTSKMTTRPNLAPSYIRVEKMNDNYVLKGHNAGETYLGTTQQFSNFELSFDMPYIQTKTIWGEDGNAILPTCSSFFIGWGFEQVDTENPAGYQLADQAIEFQPRTKIVPTRYPELAVTPEAYPFFTPGNERGISIKVTVIDAQAKLYLKWIDETNWTEVLSFQTGTKTSLGYVQLWMLTPVNLAIDNFKITNMDENPNQITVDDNYYVLEKPADYEYEKAEVVYKNLSVKEETFNWYLLIPITAAVCVVCLGIIWGVTTWIRRKKGGNYNEE